MRKYRKLYWLMLSCQLCLLQLKGVLFKLKKLCATRWPSRIEAVRALKNCYADILKVLACISLTTKDAKERADATGWGKAWRIAISSCVSLDCRLADATQAFKVNVFYKILDVAIGQLEWRFEGQQLVAGLFSFIFTKTMLKLTDAELESNAESLRKAFPPDFGLDLIPEVRSFRREFRDELTSCESVKDVLALLLSSIMLSSLPGLASDNVVLPTTVCRPWTLICGLSLHDAVHHS